MADPDLQIRGGPGHPDPEKMAGGGGRSPKNIFRPFGPQFALKIRGRGPRAPPKVPVLERVHSTPLFIWVKPCFVVSFPACVAGTLKRGGGGGGGGGWRSKQKGNGRSKAFSIYMGKPEIPDGKSNGSRHSLQNVSENMGCDLRQCNFSTPFSLFS